MTLVHLSFGSNLSDRLANINQGVDALRRLLAVSADPASADSMILSDPIESDPWGYNSSRRYINVGVNMMTTLDPFTLLEIVQQAESTVNTTPHREVDGSYADRILDIDIIIYGDTVIDTPRLTLPHPRATLRDFVMIPYHQLNPDRPIGPGKGT